MPNYIAQVSFQASSGLPTDRFVNTFSFTGTGTKETDGDAIWARLDDFYNGFTVGAGTISSYLANGITGGVVKVYDRDDAEPRIANENALTTLDVRLQPSDLPREVALVLSFHGDPPITPRRRGRVFLGPFNMGAITPPGEPTGDLMNAMRRAAERLEAASTVDLRWVIYSPSSGLSTFVLAGWVDNVWDTMRSRGEEVGQRYTWPI